MPYITPRGNPTARIWIITERPYPSDIPKGTLFSGGLGFVFDKMLQESGLNNSDVYVISRRPDTDTPLGFGSVDSSINHYQPPFIIALNEVGTAYLKEMKLKEEDDSHKSALQKNVGSLLQSPNFTHPHYMMPLYGPDRCVQDWTERNVTTYVDLQKLRDEFIYWRGFGRLQTLPERELFYGDMEVREILNFMDECLVAKRVSLDIETVYPKADTSYVGHPGYPITIGMAPSKSRGMSFNLFRERPEENRILWRGLADFLEAVPQIIGQNFFLFDSHFVGIIGFHCNPEKFSDTLIRHHILWPELPHKLQFLTRQYTREPYYKDEGKHWNLKDMSSLRRYNCLDVCVTAEVHDGQELEFNERPYLR